MRTSSRTEILDAAIRVVDALGAPDITYASVANEAGMTKAGVMYHFPSRDEMMVAVIEHVIDRWQAELEAALAHPFAESTLTDRVKAFLTFAGEGSVTQGEFVVFAEAVGRPELSAPWRDYLHKWFDFGTDIDTTPQLIVWLAINGLWISDATGVTTVTPAQRSALLSRLLQLVEGTSA